MPCYNEQDSIGPFLEAVWSVLDDATTPIAEECRIVFIDDGSVDSTLQVLRDTHKNDSRNVYVSFSRNFGKEAAMLAGMRTALDLGASHVAIMDVDLQDPPDLLPQLAERMESASCDVVATYRETRTGEPPIRSWFAHRFYGLINALSEVKMRDGARDYRLMSRRVVQSIVDMPETERFSKGLFDWVGYKTEWIGYENIEREHGETHWSFFSLVWYALDGIVAFSIKPLMAVSILGLIAFILSILFLLIITIRARLFGDPVAGWPSLVCIISFFSALNLLGVGIVGIYVSKMYSEVKRRPSYLVAEYSGDN